MPLENNVKLKKSSLFPKVAIIVPIKDEPENVIKRMLESLIKIEYPNYEVVIVDNSTISLKFDFNPFIQKSNFSLRVIRKEGTKGFKAGAINYACGFLDNLISYILILDSDHAPKPMILKILVPYLQSNHNWAFVQAPQRFEINNNKILSQAFIFQQRIFFDHLYPGMSKLKTLFMTGTNMLIRKEALDDVSGFDESTITEDIRTTLQLNQRGWDGVYVNETLAEGYCPHDFASYHKQQRRWAIGTFQTFFAALKLLLKSPASLRFEQWFQYIGSSGAWYFQGIYNLFLVWSSIVFLATGVKVYTPVVDDLLLIIIFSTLVFQVVNEHKKNKTGYFTLFLSQAIFFGNSIVFILAFIDLILNRNISFKVTKKTESLRENPSTSFTAYHLFYVCSSIIIILFYLNNSTKNYSPGFLFWTVFFTLQSSINLLLPWFFLKRVKYKNIKM